LCGVDTEYFRPIEAGRNPPVFVAVGRFVEKKAPHITLLAFREVWAELPAARLIMIGDGVLLDACKQLAQSLGIASAVQFPGPLNASAVRDTLQQARVFVQHSVTAPSGDSEGTAISLLEAAATGLPVVSTWHGGIQDTMVHGQTGFLVEELDFRAMAKHMLSLGSDPERATSMGQCARQRVVTTYSMNRSIEGLHRILTHAVESRGSHPL
jgi:glycosyltransferase involved in cell wall biosynthesis